VSNDAVAKRTRVAIAIAPLRAAKRSQLL